MYFWVILNITKAFWTVLVLLTIAKKIDVPKHSQTYVGILTDPIRLEQNNNSFMFDTFCRACKYFFKKIFP